MFSLNLLNLVTKKPKRILYWTNYFLCKSLLRPSESDFHSNGLSLSLDLGLKRHRYRDRKDTCFAQFIELNKSSASLRENSSDLIPTWYVLEYWLSSSITRVSIYQTRENFVITQFQPKLQSYPPHELTYRSHFIQLKTVPSISIITSFMFTFN